MKEVRLNNGVMMPAIGYGVFLVSPEECERCVLDAISSGYRLIDTAQAYFNEEGVGAAVSKCGVPRDEIFITTKVWISNAGEEKAAKSIDESLRKLRTDYVDLLLIHQAYGDVYGSWRAMEKALAEEAARLIPDTGEGNAGEGLIEEAADIATQMRLKVGNYAQREDAAQRVAENSDLLYRNGEDVALGLADRYQKRVTSKAGEVAEAYQDNMRSVKILQEEIAKETGRPIADFENAYDRENHENSINKIEQEQYIRDVMKPTEKVLAKIQLRKWKNKEFITFDEIEKYLIAKHGLERNVSIGSPQRYPMFSRK